jgi:uncharacterized DUF497 family protein
MIILGLQWDDKNLDHIIEGHRIIPSEVEDVCFGRHYAITAKYDRKAIYGQAGSGRYLLIILVRLYDAIFRPITARNMTQAERRKFNQIMGQ